MQPVGWLKGPGALILAAEFTAALYVKRQSTARSRGGVTTPPTTYGKRSQSLPWLLPRPCSLSSRSQQSEEFGETVETQLAW